MKESRNVFPHWVRHCLIKIHLCGDADLYERKNEVNKGNDSVFIKEPRVMISTAETFMKPI